MPLNSSIAGQAKTRKSTIGFSDLIEDALRDPFSGIGKPEPLKYNLAGYWSRRITSEHRLVYRVTDDAIVIVGCKYHYSRQSWIPQE